MSEKHPDWTPTPIEEMTDDWIDAGNYCAQNLADLRDEALDLRESLAAMERERDEALAGVRNGLTEWRKSYESELDEADKLAESFKAEGDMYGWNFHQGRRSGFISTDIALHELKALVPQSPQTPREGGDEQEDRPPYSSDDE